MHAWYTHSIESGNCRIRRDPWKQLLGSKSRKLTTTTLVVVTQLWFILGVIMVKNYLTPLPNTIRLQ
jgi:hypothetical protein